MSMASTKQAEIAARGWQVPSFTADVFEERKAPWAILIPVINEGERIQNQLREMAGCGFGDSADTIVVDGGSSDGSLAHDFLRGVGVRALLTKTGAGKLSAQLRCGYAWALLEGYQGIVTVDGNGKDGVDAIPAFIAALQEGYGYVQASRFIDGGRGVNTPLHRTLAIRLVHAPLQSLAARRWLTDTTQGFRGYSSAFLLDPRTQPFRDIFLKYELLAYLTGRASRLGYRVKELPTVRTYPADGPAPTKIEGIGPLADLVMVALRVAAGRYNPPAP